MRLNKLAAQLVFNPDDIAKTAISSASAKRNIKPPFGSRIVTDTPALFNSTPSLFLSFTRYPTIREISSKRSRSTIWRLRRLNAASRRHTNHRSWNSVIPALTVNITTPYTLLVLSKPCSKCLRLFLLVPLGPSTQASQ